MHGNILCMYINRFLENDIRKSLSSNPVSAIIGPRQSGKSTLAKKIIGNESIYLDLEKPSDLQKLEDAEWFFSTFRDKLICLDEIQRKPEIFPLIRSLTDEWGKNGSFLILGSASRDLLQQSSESLAGRIKYNFLPPFTWKEIQEKVPLEAYLVKGGFPRSILASDEISGEWRSDFIMTFLERDLLQWSGFSTKTMRNLWQMLAYNNGQVINYSGFGKSLGTSNVTVKNYIHLLESTFMVVSLPPYTKNVRKRIVKNPKIYLTDTGIINSLLKIQNFEQLTGHPVFGSLWETLVLSNLRGHFPNLDYSFYRTSNGAEIDLVIEFGLKKIAVECKASFSPVLTKGNYNAIEDIKPDKTFIASPVKKGWPVKRGISVVAVDELIDEVADYFFN